MTVQSARRVGVFGGSFDPVHLAHVALADAALAGLQLDELRWIPAGQPWQKARAITSAAHREAMLRLAIANEPRFLIDRIEVDRSGPSYTIDTLRALNTAQPATQWFLLIGHDQYAALHSWRDWQALLGLVTLAVARRPIEPRPVHPVVAAHARCSVPLPMLDISSTDIRERVARGADISQLVPPAVARYIESHGLYRAAPRS